MGVLKVNVGDAVTPDWRDVGCEGSGPGFLKLWTGTEWVRERCADDVTVANLLSADDSAFEGSSTTWFSPAFDNHEAVSSDAAHSGSQSLNITTDAPTASWVGRIGIPSAHPSTSYSFGIWIRTRNASPTNDVYLILQTVDAMSVDTQTTIAGPVTVSTTWTHITATATTPADTVIGRLAVEVDGTFGTGIDAFIDDAEVLGSIPIPGHPLKMWDGSAWQTVACMVPA